MLDLCAPLSIGAYGDRNDAGDVILTPCRCDPDWPHVSLYMLANVPALAQGTGGKLEVGRVVVSLN